MPSTRDQRGEPQSKGLGEFKDQLLRMTPEELLASGRAAIGIWPAGFRIRRAAPDGCERSVRALVVDTGFVPGAAEDERVALVRASCARLAEHGFTQLVLFTSPGSPGRDALHTLATRVEPYYLSIGLPEPPDAAQRGVYVDHLYF